MGVFSVKKKWTFVLAFISHESKHRLIHQCLLFDNLLYKSRLTLFNVQGYFYFFQLKTLFLKY